MICSDLIFQTYPAPLWIGTGLALALAVVFWLRFADRPPSVAKSAVKTASVAVLAGLAPFTEEGTALLALALGLCALGDYALSRSKGFVAGVAAFAAGHVAYIALFLTSPHARTGDLLTPPQPLLGAGLALFAVAMGFVLFRAAGALRWAVLGYVPVITAMAFTALAFPPFGGLALIPIAALLFLASDTVLAAELFLVPKGRPVRRILPFVVWPLYWTAQAGFFLGLGWIPVK